MNRFRSPPGYYSEQLLAPRYDFHVIDALHAFHSFFGIPMGAPTARGMKTSRDTNMTEAHALPSGTRFMATGIRVLFIPDCTQHRGRRAEDEQDAMRVLLGGELRFRIANRNYVEAGPLALFPSLVPKTWFAELAYLSPEAEDAHWQVIYDAPPARIGRCMPFQFTPVFIDRNQYFAIEILAEPAPLNAPGKLGVILDGHLIRSAL